MARTLNAGAIRPLERPEQAVRDFNAHMAPVNSMRLWIYNRVVPSYTIYPDGQIVTTLPQWAVEALAQCDLLAEQVSSSFPWQSYGLEKLR